MMRLVLNSQMDLSPGFRSDIRDLMVGHPWQAGENVFEIIVRSNFPPAASFDDGVDDGSPFSGIRVSHEEPVFLANGGQDLFRTCHRKTGF
jgi:hypothetical protein